VARIGEVESIDGNVIKVSLNKSVSLVRESTNYQSYGVDSVPPIGTKVMMLDLGSQSDKLIAGVRKKEAQNKALPGENRLFNDFGAEVYLKQDGTIGINGDGKSFMMFDDFVSTWNAFIAAYVSHVHLDPVSGSTAPPTFVLTPTETDMDPSENQTVKSDG